VLRVFEKLVLRKICGPKRDEVIGERKRVDNEELDDLYPTSDFIRVIKSRMMRCAGHVARVVERRMHSGFWWINLRETDYLGNIGVDRWIIFKRIFKKYNGDLD
jgi:hypothetical protein